MSDLEGVVFERPLPRSLGGPFVVVMVVALGFAGFAPAMVDDLADVAKGLPWVDADLFSAVLVGALTGSSGLLGFAGAFWASRRYGRAVITGDHG